MKLNRKQKYQQLFLSALELSACTFGGGFVIIPLLQKKFVDELGWIEESDMMDLTAIAQTSPGAIAVNASILVGYYVAGFSGALLTVVGTILPPLVIISIVSMFYQTFRDNIVVNMAMSGMLCGVAAVIFDVVMKMVQVILQQKRMFPVFIIPLAFAAIRFWNVNIMVILLLCGALGAMDVFFSRRKQKAGEKE